jgi:Right handed beta helix region
MHRRHFIGLGGAAALLGTAEAEAAPLQAIGFAGSVADWGIEANAERDQSSTMQKAINELAAGGQPIVIPAGRYRFARLQLPSRAAVFGVPGLTMIAAPVGQSVFECVNKQDVGLRGVTFAGTGLVARDCRNLTIADCEVLTSDGDGLFCSGAGLFVARNRVASCAKSAIWVDGDGMVTNNIISGEGQFGLRLGGPRRLGTMTVINNLIGGTAVGIGVSNASDGYAFIAMNMITGAKKGGIRALNGEDLTGKDLTQGGSEAFRNLAIAANVSV